MQKPVLVACILAVLSLAAAGLAQGDATHHTDIDILPGLLQEFQELDAELNTVYQQARAQLPEAAFQELRDSQRDWLESRDLRAHAYASFNRPMLAREGDPEEFPEYWEALGWFTGDRTDFVRGWLQAFDGTFTAAGPWEGVWVDSYGGRLRLLDLGQGQLLFDLQVVRGPTLHLGDIGGHMVATGNTALHSQWVEYADEAAQVQLSLDGPLLSVEPAGATRYFHGARAYFDGSYTRTHTLDAGERNELLRLYGLP